MKRQDEIAELRRRYRLAMDQRKWKLATLIWVRLDDLMQTELRVENRKVKRSAA